MNATKPPRHPVLKLLYKRLQLDHESFFFSPSSLQNLGIQASQVDITDDGVLQFQPCFFRPYPERVLQLYPLDMAMTEAGLPKLYYQPDFASILEEVRLSNPDAEDALQLSYARDAYESCAMLSAPDEWDFHARDTERYIRLVNRAPRKGRPILSSLSDLGSLRIPQ